jgi:CheY-like chemotaxis protein
MNTKTIWVVDDDPIYQIIIQKIIQKSKLFSAVLKFVNGNEAIVALKQTIENKETLPDIILLDINMPIMDGWEFMDEVLLMESKINKKIAIYIVSSSIAIEDKYRAKTYLTILGYLSKPVTVENLIKIASFH